jgi:parallel beta-helix repeat protein
VNNEWHPVGVQTCAEGWKKTGDCGCEPILDECKENEIPLFGGGCHKVGPECQKGWKEMEGGGCEPILDDCPEGTIQKIGGGCEKVGPQDECGEGKWGNIPKEVTSDKIIYVWAGYQGTDSVGSQEKPFIKIQDAINAAKKGDTVAIGANVEEGSILPYEEYNEGIVISKTITVRGRCSKMVKITGEINTDFAGVTAAIYIIGSKNIKISGLSVIGTGSGIVIFKGEGHEIKNVKSSGNHGIGIGIGSANINMINCIISNNIAGQGQNYGWGIYVLDNSDVTVKSCSVDGNTEIGISVITSKITIESSIVKNTKLDNDQKSSWGIDIHNNSEATIKSCSVESNLEVGIYISSSKATIESSIVRDTKPANNNDKSAGIVIQNKSDATISFCSVVGNTGLGIVTFSSTATIKSSMVMDTKPDKNIESGRGINIQDNSEATITSCSVNGNTDCGIFVFSSKSTIESSIVKDTRPNKKNESGRGIGIQDKSDATIKSCSVEGNASAGIHISSSITSIESSVIKDTKPNNKDELGHGIAIQNNSEAMIKSCSVEGNTEVGILVTSSIATIESNIVKDTKSKKTGEYGQGIDIQDNSEVTIKSCLVEKNIGAGITIFSSKANIESSMVRDTKYDNNGEMGWGIDISDNSASEIKSCSVEGNTQVGILVTSSKTTIEFSRVQYTKPDNNGLGGSGFFIQGNDSQILINNCKIFNNHASGIGIIGSRGEIRNSHIKNILKSKGKWSTDEGIIVDVPDLADGIEIINSSDDVIIEGNIIESCERAGVIFDNSTGSFTNNTISRSQFGYVFQSSSEVEESGNMFIDNEVDKNINPEEPLPVDNVEKKIPGL